MEEARQHPPLKKGQWIYLALLFGGVLALLLGIVLSFALDQRAILIAGAVWLATRITMAMMRIAWAGTIFGAVGKRPSRLWAAIDLLFLLGLATLAVSIGITEP